MSSKTLSPKERFVVIMAGGRGERFWPVSRQNTPKQLIRLLGDRSLLQQAVDRVLPLAPAENVLVITNAAQAREVRRQLPGLPKNNIIAEPCGRDTCAAVALGAALVGQRSKNAVMAVLPADHVIPTPKSFQLVLREAFAIANGSDTLVTIGIKPTEPATGYGYILTGAPLDTTASTGKPTKTPFFKAERFVEKPSLERATEYLATGKYRWNAGMFIWSYRSIAKALQTHQPELAKASERWLNAAALGRLDKTLATDYPTIAKISVDYALMEKATNVAVADGNFEWDDLGAWPALARHLAADAAGNCSVGDFIHTDSSGNIVFDARTKTRTLTAIIGLQDCIVVHTDDATLVAHKAKAQKIKDLVGELAKTERFKSLL